MKLRLGLVFAAVCYLAATPAFAQGFSVKGGVNFANIESDDDDEGCCSTRTGFVVGGAFEVPLSPALSIQPEVLYTQGGTKFDVDDFDEKPTLKFNFIDVPVLIKANFSGGNAKPFVVVGPVFGFKSGDVTIEVDGETVEEVPDDDVESVNVAIAFGGGVQIGKLIVEARYNLGLTDVDKSDDSTKTRGFLALVGFRF